MDDDDVLLTGEVDQLLEEVEVDAGRGGVVRERADDHPRAGPGVLEHVADPVEELPVVVDVGGHGHLAHRRAGEERPPDVDRVRRGGHDRRVARPEEHPHEVAEPLLGADGGDDLGVGVEIDVEAPLVEVGHRLAQLGDAAARRVPVVAGVVGCFGELVDGDLGRGQVGVAEPEVDHIGARSPCLHLQPIDDGEDVWGHPGDPTELHRSTVVPRLAHLRTPSRPRGAKIVS